MWSWTPPASASSPVRLTHPRHCRPQRRQLLRKGGKGAENQRVRIQRRRRQQQLLWPRHQVQMGSSLWQRRLSMAAIVPTRVGTSARRHQPQPLNHLHPPNLLFPQYLFPTQTCNNSNQHPQRSHYLPPRNQQLRRRIRLAV